RFSPDGASFLARTATPSAPFFGTPACLPCAAAHARSASWHNFHPQSEARARTMKLSQYSEDEGPGCPRAPLHRLLTLAATCALALVIASVSAADTPAVADPDIARLVREISPARLESY